MNRKKRSIMTSLVELSVIPVFLLGVIMTVISAQSLMKGMQDEVRNSLAVAAHSVYNTYSLIAPGDLAMIDGKLVKGTTVIDGDYAIVDALKQSYDMEITLFYGDKRVLTTIIDSDGNRLIGTKANDETVKWVIEHGREYFSPKVSINNVEYFGYYVPIYNKDKSIAGMAFAGKKRSDVLNSVRTIVLQSSAISLMFIISALLCCIVASQKMVKAIKSIMDYLGHVANSDFSVKMSYNVLRRNDEIGDMGHYASIVSKSLKDMITTDPLTGLYNRRACKNYLEKWITTCQEREVNKICVAIGDIDFFKKINDQYGHDCGDIVLVTVSEVFKKHLDECGFVSRWGGEEFLLTFEMGMDEAKKKLQTILEEIRNIDFEYDNESFKITFTFGLNNDIVGLNFDDIVKKADNCLYMGKQNGRNQIVTSEEEIIYPIKPEMNNKGETE